MASRDLCLLSRILKRKRLLCCDLRKTQWRHRFKRFSLAKKELLNEGKKQTNVYNQVWLPTNRFGNKHKMALKTQKGSNLPEGAVPVSSEEALKYQWTFIKNWPSESEVLSLKFGRHITAATTFISSVYLINFFRKTLNATRLRFFVTSVPGAIIPSVMTYYLTDIKITNPTLLMKLNCPICNQLDFAVSQFYFSLIFPALFGYGTLAGFASVTGSYPIPNIGTHGKEFWKFSYQMVKRGTHHYQVVGLFQIVLVLFLPYFQNKQLHNVMNKAREKESESFDNELELNY